jgi:glutamine amidotransferase
MIRIIDYGLGNISAFLNVYKRLNVEAGVARTSSDLKTADKLILPGVGAFDQAIDLLNGSGMRESLDELVLGQKVPVLGVCVGMQILANSSEEGVRGGLGWVPGKVKHLRSMGGNLQLPHMGWNDVTPIGDSGLFAGLQTGARFYFLHSFFFDCDLPADVSAVANYGGDFCCAVHKANVFGAQFHPEKSHHFGAKVLQNFAELH